MIENLTKKTKESRKKLLLEYKDNILTIPFEQFVLDEKEWVNKIAKTIGTNIIEETRKTIKLQNVPRDMVSQWVDLEIYRRCGWKPPEKNSTERDELNIRRQEIAQEVSPEALLVLDKLSKEYENQYWKVED